VSPDRFVEIAERVHDAENYDLGGGSTRSYRNEFWARVVGIVHFGHPVYNLTPDPSWCLKDAGGGRPQSDDVGVKCSTREFWDFIGGVGANGYSFRVGAHPGERLPKEQNVFPPPRPDTGGVTPPPPPPVDPVPPPADLAPVLAALATLTEKVDAVAALALAARDAALDAKAEAEQAKVNASDIKHVEIPKVLEALKGGAIPCLRGRVPRALGGSSEVTFCPVEP